MATVIPGSVQNQDRTELVALRRLGTVEHCAKVVEFLAMNPSDYVTGAVIPMMAGWCGDKLAKWHNLTKVMANEPSSLTGRTA